VRIPLSNCKLNELKEYTLLPREKEEPEKEEVRRIDFF
jgi:hypothetical protein